MKKKWLGGNFQEHTDPPPTNIVKHKIERKNTELYYIKLKLRKNPASVRLNNY